MSVCWDVCLLGQVYNGGGGMREGEGGGGERRGEGGVMGGLGEEG